ncbi:MAG TPA: hypoxanthine phosphoribosyltransferase [Actinomycetota bacterium]
MPLAEVLFTADQIQQRVRGLAAELLEDLAGERPLLISVLKGSVIFLADLVRALGAEADIDFMSITAYPGAVAETGVVRIVKDLEEPLEGRHVVIVEDIVDTGLTLSYLLRTLQTRGPSTLRVCTLVDKAVRRIADLQVDLVGFESEEFLIGYGLDFQGRYRNLPYLMAVRNLAALAAEPNALEWVFDPPQTAP